jgi:hypothetical protein
MTNQDEKTQRSTTPRPTFTIDNGGNVRAFGSPADVPDGAVKFETEKEFRTLVAEWSGPRLVQVWNNLAGAKRIQKFTDRKTAVRRIWQAIQELAPTAGGDARTGARRGPHSGKVAAGSERRAVPRPSTKTARIIALLKRPAGATLKAIMALTGWQPHSVRGFISAQLSKRMGMKIESFQREGERVYRIVPSKPAVEIGGKRRNK